MNYKKSLLSLVTILALNSNISADSRATYIPLTNTDNDKAWIMFGVNEFSNGISSSTATTVASFSVGTTVEEEASVSDSLATSGFPDAGGDDMASFQALQDADGNDYFTALKMGIDVTDVTYTETQPIRSMYIAIRKSSSDTNSISKVKLNYKATLEGKTVELQIDGDTSVIYSTKISSQATFESPAIATPPVENSTNTHDLVTPSNVLAYNLSHSPVLPAAYSKDDHQDEANFPDANARFYHYDPANNMWKIWDRDREGLTGNDLVEFEKGKAYWGKLDIDNIGSTNSDTRAGLVLGKTSNSIADASVYTGKLTPNSWNMVAFDPAKHPDIRNATTGLIVDASDADNTDTITLWDETGVNSVAITLNTANAGATEEIAQQINETIESAKILGKVPDTFNIKAFAADDTDTNIIFLSDKKFTIADDQGAGECLTTAKTIAGFDDVVRYDGTKGTVNDIQDNTSLATTGATSVYGEYMMVIEALADAADLDDDGNADVVRSAKVVLGNVYGDSASGALATADNDTAFSLTNAIDNIDDDDIFNSSVTNPDGILQKGKVTTIDTDFNGAVDMLVLAANTSFYIRDNTYSRVYDYTVPAASQNFVIRGSGTSTADSTIASNNTNIDDLIDNINAKTDTGDSTIDTYVYATKDATTGTKLVLVSAYKRAFDLLDTDTDDVDLFDKTSLTTEDITKGAVKRVINIAKLTRENLVTDKFQITFTADADGSDGAADDGIQINGIALTGDAIAFTAPADDSDRIAMLDTLVDQANQVLKDNEIAAFASHNYIDGMNDITKAVITIEGMGLDSVTLTEDDGVASTDSNNGADNPKPGTIKIDSALIVSDLKDNAVYTPDYVNGGPLYTLKDAGYEAKAIIRASTKLANTPLTHWDHIDLTRDSKYWLKNNEYNLFSVNNSSGYWVYIEDYTNPNSIQVANVSYTPSFTHYFDTVNDNTVNVINSAQLTLEINGISPSTSNAKLIVGGNEVQLTNQGDNLYTAFITEYEAPLSVGSTNTISIKVADGVGETYEGDIISVDYEKPNTPSVGFLNGTNIVIESNSTDVAKYYLYKDFISDITSGANQVDSNITTDLATSYNICQHAGEFDTDPTAVSTFKIVALDGNGVRGSANISNATKFTYIQALKDSIVQTHGYGDATSSVASYNSCEYNTTGDKTGIELASLVEGTIRIAYQALNTSDTTNDVPYVSYFNTTSDGDTATIKITALPGYANRRFYVESGSKLYTGLFLDEAASDSTLTSPKALTEVNADNVKLSN